MTAKKLSCIALLTFVFTIVSYAQESAQPPEIAERENPKTTTLVDEFGRATDCDMSARVDNLFIQLNNNLDATGYIITYVGVDFLPSQVEDPPMARQIRQSMAFRKYDMGRIVFISGGLRETQGTEFWLVPEGAIPPEPTKTVPKPKVSKNTTILWAKSWVTTEVEVLSINEFILPEVQAKLDEESRLADIETDIENAKNDQQVDLNSAGFSDDQSEQSTVDDEATEEEQLSPEEIREQRFAWVNKKFASQIASRKESHGVIIFYADDLYYDISKIQQFVEQARNIITLDAKISPNSIQVLFGGYRDMAEAEYWLVPKGGSKPEAKPEERPIEGLEETNK